MTNADRRRMESLKIRSVKALDLAKRAMHNKNTIVALFAFRLYRDQMRDLQELTK